MPVFEITSPDGRKFRVEGPEGSTKEQALAQVQQANQPPAQNRGASGSWDDSKPLGSVKDAIAEPALAMATGAVAMPVAGIAGAAATPFVGHEGASDIINKVSGAMTYQPRTQLGQKGLDIASYPFQKLAQFANWAGENTAEAAGSPALGAGVNTAIQSAPALLARGRMGNGRGSAGGVRSDVEAGSVPEAQAASQASGWKPRLERVSEKPEAVKPPTVDELKTQAKAAYKRADDAGITISGNSIKGLKTRIASSIRGIDPTLHPSTTAAVKRVMDSEGNLSLSEVDTLRQIAKDAQGSISAADRRLAANVVDEIDNFIDGLDQADVTTGNAAQAAALKEARNLYSRQKKAEEIQDLFERAELTAPNFSGSGMENALRTEFRALAKNKNRMRRFTAQEQAAIKKVALGGPVENLLRQIGKLAPTGIVSAGMGSLAGFTIGGPIGAAVVPAVGIAGRSAATRMTMRNATRAEELMRAGPQASALTKKKRNALAETQE